MRHTSQQNATVPQEALTSPQSAALAALLAGESVTAAAAAASVDRSTVHRWLRFDHAFAAALNASRRELHDALRAKLLGVAEKAAECVGKAVEAGDVRVALAVLKGLGFFPGELARVGSDDPRDLRIEAAQKAQHQNLMASLVGG